MKRFSDNKKFPKVGQLIRIGWLDTPDTIGLVTKVIKADKEVEYFDVSRRPPRFYSGDSLDGLDQIIEFGPMVDFKKLWK